MKENLRFLCRMRSLLYACTFFLLLSPGMKAQLVINEIMPANSSSFLDPTNNYSGWVEFYNPGNEPYSLSGHYLSDDSSHPKKYRITDRLKVIPANGYLVYWFDHNDLRSDQATFKLDCFGGSLLLTDSQGKEVVRLLFPEQIQHTSYARITDGAEEWGICTTPTPGSTNRNSAFAFERCPEPEFNLKGGVYRSACILNLTCPTGMEIRYTTDGSEPTETSPKWTKNKQFSATTVLRARVLAKGCIPGAITTQSYIFSDRDFTLPVLSIVTDPKNLWDDKIGIYCVGTNGVSGWGMSYPVNWNKDWSRPANIELLDVSKQLFSQECDIAVTGNYSRQYPMKSLKLNAEKKFDGKNYFPYSFFSTKPGLKYKSLMLRNSGGDFEKTMLLDAMQQALVEKVLDVEHQAYQPVVYFVNGEYYGIINIRERSNQHYVYANYGYDKDSIDFIKNRTVTVFGSKTAYKALVLQSKEASTSSVYEEIKEKLDIDAFIVYMLTEMFVANWDWPGNNNKLFRHRNNGKFRWILFDLDAGFQGMTDYNSFIGPKNSIVNSSDPLDTEKYSDTSFLLFNLWKNKAFRKRFIDYYTICLGSVFRTERVLQVMDSIAAGIQTEIPYHQQRWNTDAFESGIASYKRFAHKRVDIVLKQMQDFFNLPDYVNLMIQSNVSGATLSMNAIPLPLGKMDGCTYLGNQLILDAKPPAGYKFKQWSVLAQDVSSLPLESFTKSKIKLTVKEALNVQAVFVPLEETAGIVRAPIRINEVSAANKIQLNEYYKKEDWIELYNTTDKPVSIAGLFISRDQDDLTQYQIPDGLKEFTVIPPYGYRILWADKMEDLTQLHLPFKLPAEGGTIQLSHIKEDTKGNSTVIWSDLLTYSPHSEVQSFGRYPDGGDSVYVMHKNTFSASNYFSIYNVNHPELYTSIEEIRRPDHKNNHRACIYYNPASAILTVEMLEESSLPQELIIYNLAGQPQAARYVPAYQAHYDIALAELPSGYYLVVLSTSEGQKVNFRFVK